MLGNCDENYFQKKSEEDGSRASRDYFAKSLDICWVYKLYSEFWRCLLCIFSANSITQHASAMVNAFSTAKFLGGLFLAS